MVVSTESDKLFRSDFFTGDSCVWSHTQQVNKMLQGECVYRGQRCLSPWAALFIWAVLQNRTEMAVYFWEMVRP